MKKTVLFILQVIFIYMFIINNGDCQNLDLKGQDGYYFTFCHEDSWVEKVERNKKKQIASSVLQSDSTYSYSVEKIFDGKLETCWCPERGKSGIGNLIVIKIPSGSKGIVIHNGLQANKDLFFQNNRVKKMFFGFICKNGKEPGDYACPKFGRYSIRFGTDLAGLLLQDTMAPQMFDFKKNIGFDWNDSCVLDKDSVYLLLQITEVYKGSKYDDLCISEIEIIK